MSSVRVRAGMLPVVASDPGAEAHYRGLAAPLERPDLDETPPALENIGWTLGNDCPYRCTHCYSMSARRKGADLERWMVDRIVGQLAAVGIKTVNLGGNEPLFTNGLDPRKTLLPHIIRSLAERQIAVGLTTSGITLLHLERSHPDEFRLLNDVDISFDSPYAEEHNHNRGAALYGMALQASSLCQTHGIDHTIIMCAMRWNFTASHIDALVSIARRTGAHVRINPLKPVERQHMADLPSPELFYTGFARLMAQCEQIDLGEPLLAAACGYAGSGCPCGRTSFRIHSITPERRVPVSPCVYLHDYKVGDLLTDDLTDIINSPQFGSFRRRHANPQVLEGCGDCEWLATCRGGCAARSYLHLLHETGRRSLFTRDPYCLRTEQQHLGEKWPVFPRNVQLDMESLLVHRNYLCTWIGRPL